MELLHYAQFLAPKVPVVLLHGYCESSSIWIPIAKKLAEEYDVICPDLPGFGRSEALQAPFSMEDMAEEIFTLLSDLEVKRCVMIGHSMGGYVSLAFAEKYPEMLAGLGLFHSTAFADSNDRLGTRLKAIEFIQEHGTKKFASSLIPSLFSKKNKEHLAKTVAQLIEEASQIPNEVTASAMEAMRERPDRSSIIHRLSVPILYVVGEKDTTIPVNQSLQECFLAQDSTLVALENTGHMGMIESPKIVERRLSEFIAYCKK